MDGAPRGIRRGRLVTAATSYVVVVPLKILTDRSAPHAPWPDGVQLFTHDAGWSYPSGHVVNTLIWYPVLVALIQRALRRKLAARVERTLLVAPVVIVFVAVTYLGYRWLTDSVAGVLLASPYASRCTACPWKKGCGSLFIPLHDLAGASGWLIRCSA